MSKEKLSALMDDELTSQEVREVLEALHQDASLLNDWNDWHYQAGLMQGDQLLSQNFASEFSARLASEPTIFAPKALHRKKVISRKVLIPMTMAASIAFVSFAMWRLNHIDPNAQDKQWVAEVDQNKTINLHPYLSAHREIDGNPFPSREILSANYQASEAP